MQHLDLTLSNTASSQVPTLDREIVSSYYNRITVSNFSNWYDYEGTLLVGFPLLRKYENILKTNLQEITLDRKYWYRPEYLSYALYETTDLWYVILFVNDMLGPLDFKTPTVKVPNTALVSVISQLVTDEGNGISDRFRPTPIRQNFLKRLNEPSERILPDERYNHVDFVELPNMSSKLNSSEFQSDYYVNYFSSSLGWLTDEEGRLVPAIKLNPDGLKQLPSIYYPEGLTKTFKGRIKLKKGTRYSLNAYLNGEIQMTLKDKSGFTVTSLKKANRYKEATLIMDNRGANADLFKKQLDSGTKEVIQFDKKTGKYYFDQKNLSVLEKPKAGSNKIYLNDLVFKGDAKEDILRASRLTGKKNIFSNLCYSFDSGTMTDRFFKGFGYEVIISYKERNQTVQTDVYSPNLKHFTTHGRIAYLKAVLVNRPGLTIDHISIKPYIKVSDDVKNTASPYEFSYELYSVELSEQDDKELNKVFQVSQSSWYDVEFKYTYKLHDQAGMNLFKNESFTGILFEPTVTEAKEDDSINHLKRPLIREVGKLSSSEKTNIKNPYRLPYDITSPNDILNIGRTVFSNQLKLPKKYIIDFRMAHTTKSSGGGVGFIVDYDQEAKTGYMFWISSTADNPHLSPYKKTPDGTNIMPTGFYELDDIYGERKLVFEDDEEFYLNVTNYRPLAIEGATVRIIKRENRIKVYIKKKSGWDFNHPEIDVEDLSSIHMNGGLGLMTIGAGMDCEILDYITWDTYDPTETAEW